MKLSGHTSVRSLAKYARVSDDALLNFQADTDPAARRHVQRPGGQSVAGGT
jgi:integrase/recombinase XerC/integrase/recombinase XerD